MRARSDRSSRRFGVSAYTTTRFHDITYIGYVVEVQDDLFDCYLYYYMKDMHAHSHMK